ncbi:MAG: LysR substrate-binding domain-containing protein [Gammaproteobacteria bacterium]
MTLTELRYVVAVARHRHFGKAAEACFVSQPTLSVGIRKLEDELGVRLFERTRSDVIITPIGEALVAQAREVLTAAEALRDMAEAAQDPLGSQLVLGVIYTVGPYLIPRLITALKARAPKLTLIVREGFTDELAEQLRGGELDCAIMSLPFRDPRLVSRPLYEEPFTVAVPRDHPLAGRDAISAGDLAGETLLLLGARNCFREQVIEACPACITPDDSAAGEMQKTLEGSSLDTICQMVAAGAGVTVVPSTMPLNEDLGRHIVYKPFAAPAPARTIAAFYRRGFARPELINCIAQSVHDAELGGVHYVD